MNSKYARLLNELDTMQQSVVYAARKSVLSEAEQTIVRLESDHARCVREAREVMRKAQYEIATRLIKEPEFERLCLENPLWQQAQRFLDTWKEEA